MNALIFRENTADLDEMQILSHIMQYAHRNSNPETLAAALLDSFGSLKNILEARPEQLQAVPGIGAKTAGFVASLLGLVRAWQRSQMEEPHRILNTREAEKFCLQILTGARNEEFFVIALNARCGVVGKRRISTGSLSEVNAYPRLVVETALNYNAHAILLSHNHPGGTCAPSAEDISSTIQLQKTLNSIDIMVLDHIIVANDRTYSMVQHGDIDYRARRC